MPPTTRWSPTGVSPPDPEDPTRTERRARARGRIWLLIGLFALISAAHFLTGTQGQWAHAGHVFFRKLYFVPIVTGALWFAGRGAAATSAAVVAAYSVHIWLNWSPDPFERIDQVGEMVSFVVLAALAGCLVGLERRVRWRAERARREAERHRVGTAVAALAETLGARDPETLEHSRRVARLAEAFGTYLELPRAETRSLYLAGIVHDIGKIGVRDDVLLKPETLTAEERHKIMEHPRIAEKILAPIGFERVVRYAAVHHENVDGSGYPEGLVGDQIPLAGRALAIVDTYDALGSSRPYKDPLSEAQVRHIMEEMAGKKLDADLLARFWDFRARGEIQPGEAVAVGCAARPEPFR